MEESAYARNEGSRTGVHKHGRNRERGVNKQTPSTFAHSSFYLSVLVSSFLQSNNNAYLDVSVYGAPPSPTPHVHQIKQTPIPLPQPSAPLVQFSMPWRCQYIGADRPSIPRHATSEIAACNNERSSTRIIIGSSECRNAHGDDIYVGIRVYSRNDRCARVVSPKRQYQRVTCPLRVPRRV